MAKPKRAPAGKRTGQRLPPVPTIAEMEAAFRDTGSTTVIYPANSTIFRQGDEADWVYFIIRGRVQISVLSKQGKEGMIAVPHTDGDFIGESALSSQLRYLSSAETVMKSEILKIPKETMRALIKENAEIGTCFTAFLLQHTMAVEAELVDHLFNSSEKRLARILLLLANFGHEGKLEPITNMTQELLAQRVGTTRARISYFMNKFRRLGLITYNGSIQVHSGLLNVVLHDARLEYDK